MLQQRTLMVLLVAVICIDGVTSIRDVKLRVEPPIVIRGGTATLICERDMEGAPIYSVKWYRGTFEFFRYTPQDQRKTQTFYTTGINVVEDLSNGTQVFLKRLELSLTGTFTCEVTADKSFSTQVVHKYIEIIALPTKDPILKADKDRYQPGELLKANCTSSPAKPAVNLTIYINGDPIPSSETSLQRNEEGLVEVRVNSEVEVTSEMFKQGRMRVKCVSLMYDVYRASATSDFFTPENDPRPEKITSSKSTKFFQKWLFILFLLMLPLLVMGQAEDYIFNEESFLDTSNGIVYYDEENEKKSLISLVGG